MSFPTETVNEGKVKVVVPKLSAFVKNHWEYAPSKAPVFYNPTMELNRDFAVLALQAYQKILGSEVSVCEPLTACGLRGVRFAVEVEGVHKIFLNDINPEATKLANLNAKLNHVENCIEVSNQDANLFLSMKAAPKKRLNYIDIDPFGSPAPYLDSTVRAIRDGGLLALTATDMAPLCGVHPKACLRKYGGVPLRTEYCHELAIRLLAGCLTMMATKHDIGIEVLFSYTINHYLRIYAIAHYGAKVADESIKQMGYILHCFSCFHREKIQGITSLFKDSCPNCGANWKAAGPLWLGRIADKNFCLKMKNETEMRNFRLEKRILKIITLIQNEVDAPITYYALDKFCDKLNLPVPSQKKVLNALKEKGYFAGPTHFNNRGFRTEAPENVIKDIIMQFKT